MSKRGRKRRIVYGSESEPESAPSEDVSEQVEEKVEEKVENKGEPKEKQSTGNILTNPKFLYAVIAVLLVALVATNLDTLTLPSTTLPTSPSSDITGNIVQEQGSSGIVVQNGDQVTVDYRGKHEDGEEFDSGEIDFVVGSGQMIPGFDEAVAGMRVGEEKTVTIPPEKAYGEVDPNNVMSLPILLVRDIKFNITKEQFGVALNEEPLVDKVYEVEGAMLPIKVVSVVGGDVLLEWIASVGDVVSGMEPWDINVISVNETSIIMERQAVDGMEVPTVMGQRKIVVEGDQILINMNHELAGKTLIFTIKVLDVTRLSPLEQVCSELNVPRSDKPKMELFVMSYCPFGLQMEKGMIPVQELLGEKADIEIKFLNYIMHEKKEIDENTREYCIQLEQPDKFWAYMRCFVGSGKTDECLDEAGVDKGKMDACVAKADTEFEITKYYEDKSSWSNGRFPLYKVHDDDCKKYGVQGSPTVVINGQQVSIYPRDPENVKNHICCAFNNPPDECLQTLSSASPKSGFGWGAEQSPGSTGAECGP